MHVGEIIKKISDETYLVKVSSEGKYIVKIRPALKEKLEKFSSLALRNSEKPQKTVSKSAASESFSDEKVKQNTNELEKSYLKEGTRVALKNDSYIIERILPGVIDPAVSLMSISSFENVSKASFATIGGLSEQISKITEVIELPFLQPELFESLGISQPKGVLLYGPPGTGKTLVAKAVAHSTKCTFIRVSGGELVQKYIGEGTRLVRELFKMAREKAPSIIFLDEVDSIGSARTASGKGGDSEVQRTMLELLNQLDGFEAMNNVKMIMATNRVDILDPALLRPGRIDRKIEFNLPNAEQRLEIFKIHTKKMNLRNVDLKEVSEISDKASGADIKMICTEAGMFALRERRDFIGKDDFEMAVAKVLVKNELVIGDEKKVWI